MTTLLELVNDSLLMVGEREVPNFESSVGRKGRLAVRNAQQFVGILHQWRHLRAIINTTPESFVGGTATIAPFSRIFSAFVGTLALQCAQPRTMQYKVATGPLVSTPEYYSIAGESSVEFYPTPTLLDQSRITLHVLLKPTIASNTTDTLEGPAEYVDLVSLYAQVVLHRTHTTDLNAAEATAREFETRVHMYRTLNVMQSISFMG